MPAQMPDTFWGPFWTAVPIILTIVVGFVLSILDRRSQSQKTDDKIEQNTKITIEGTKAAKDTAVTVNDNSSKVAEKVALKVDEAVVKSDLKTASAIEEIKTMLNGSLESRISEIVNSAIAPLHEAFLEHEKLDEDNMKEIRQSLEELKK